MEWATLVSLIALVVSVASPVFSTFLNNRHQERMKEIDLVTARKIQVFEGYLRGASESSYGSGTTMDFTQYKSLIFFHAPSALHEKIRLLNDRLETTSSEEEVSPLIEEVARLLSKENHISK